MAFDFSQSAYIRLRDAVIPDTGRIIVWCGAGLSAPAGVPSWGRLREILEERLLEKARNLEESERNSIYRQLPSLRNERNHWVAFQRLQSLLGITSYRETIREQMSIGNVADIPAAYQMLWRMRLAGMITLNLDALPLRASTLINSGKRVEVFTGNELSNYMHVLKNPNVRFLCHLHGVDSNITSWVFTHRDLSELAKTDGYNDFLAAILTTFTVLFVGISADDVAVGSHLQRLLKKNFDFGSHYWVTNRHDARTNEWAENTAIQTIYYSSYDGDHSELEGMLSDLTSYVPREDSFDSYPPAMHGSSLTPVDEIPPPEALATLSPEEIRVILNSRALDILRTTNPNRDAEFELFLTKYGRPIHNAWYVDTVEGENILLGYRLLQRRDRGAFGQIYKATAPDGSVVAIKLLKDEVRANPSLLHSFRRGVRAMQILSENEVKGMVAYKEAYEIPTFVAMDWIDGHDLRKAVEMGLIDSWRSLLQISLGIAEILKSAHSLHERVLHRDLRPANIMIQRAKSSQKWGVFLLDFDLSWYLGSIEQSVIHGSDSFGFLAPEQIVPRDGASTKHPSVDSFGLGMTLYYVLARKNPSPGEHRQDGWELKVRKAAMGWQKPNWLSNPRRFSRLIVNMTKDVQTDRWDLAEIAMEMKRLYEAERSTKTVQSADLIAEEIACRSNFLSSYVWDSDRQAAQLAIRQTGLELEVLGNESKRQIQLSFSSVRAERAEKNWGKRNAEAGQKIAKVLVDAGWDVSVAKSATDRTLVHATLRLDSNLVDIDHQASVVDSISNLLPRYT